MSFTPYVRALYRVGTPSLARQIGSTLLCGGAPTIAEVSFEFINDQKWSDFPIGRDASVEGKCDPRCWEESGFQRDEIISLIGCCEIGRAIAATF
jgi:hypothetical protein